MSKIARWFRFRWVQLTAVVLLGVLLEVLVLATSRNERLYLDHLTATQLGSVLGLELLIWTAFVTSTYNLMALLQRAARRARQGSGRKLITIIATTAAAALSAGIGVYLASWMFFVRVGHFLDAEAIEFGVLNFRMIANYLWQSQPRRAAAGIVILGSVFSAGMFAYRRTSAPAGHVQNSPAPSIFLSAVLTVVCFLNLALISYEIAGQSEMERVANDSIPYWKRRDQIAIHSMLSNRVNPLFTLIVDLWQEQEPTFKGELTEEQLGQRRSKIAEPRPVSSSEDEKPSVIVVAVESLRHDVVGLKSNGIDVMPNLSELARGGLVFSKAYAQSTHSNYADPCVFSSLYPLRTEHHHNYSATDPWPKVLLYDVLSDWGYQTAMFSSQNESWGNMGEFLRSPKLDLFFDS